MLQEMLEVDRGLAKYYMANALTLILVIKAGQLQLCGNPEFILASTSRAVSVQLGLNFYYFYKIEWLRVKDEG